MKKLLSLLCVIGLSFLLVACGNSADNKDKDTSNGETEKEEVNKEKPVEVTDDGKELYEVGQTTVVERRSGVKYEVTPTKFEVLTDYDGKNIEEYIPGSIDADRILVVTYTVKNIGDEDLQPSFDTVIHFDDRETYAGAPMDFQDEEKADEMLAPGEEIELQQYVADRIDTKQEFLGVFDAMEKSEVWYKFPVSQEAIDSIGKTEDNESVDKSDENKEPVEFGETGTLEKFNGAKVEIKIDNFNISGNTLTVNYTVKNVGETSISPIDDGAIFLGTEEDKGKTMPLTDPDKATEPLEPGKEIELENVYTSDDLDENKEYILRVIDGFDGKEIKFKTK